MFDWMMEVCEEFMLKRETFHMASAFVDRYLALADYEVPKQELQLIGVTAMFIAAKVEEVYVPRVGDFALSTDGGYSKDKIMEMELKMMKVLGWKLHPITAAHWLHSVMSHWDQFAETNLSYLIAQGFI